MHARHQIAHIDLPDKYAVDEIAAAINARLPDDIEILRVRKTGRDYHARHAKFRVYRYHWSSRHIFPGLNRFITTMGKPPPPSYMKKIVDELLGEHDFRAFRGRNADHDKTVTTLMGCQSWDNSSYSVLEIRGASFLKNMVRNIVGSAFWMWKNGKSPESIRKILESRDPAECPGMAPPRGLFLWWVQPSRGRVPGPPSQQ